MSVPLIVVMGVQGSGKSTIGKLLADALGVQFVDGDQLHTPESIASMAAGQALTDEERMPWLLTVGSRLASGHEGIVIACSALKRSYRELLRERAPDLFVVDPEGSMDLIAARISARRHEYMPTVLLQSQFDTLEPLQDDEHGLIVDIRQAPTDIVDSVLAFLRHSSSALGKESNAY
jgi:carbohydrate kinase (thermoresistant glucokinase family)